MSESVKELNARTFDDFISKGNCVVDFWAEWCGPCKLLSPVVDEAAKELKGKVKFGKANIEELRELTDRYEVMSIPTLIFFKDGEPVEKNSGYLDKKKLLEMIKTVF
jgi:thioredoxin 1